jgi:hypothetical protein
MKDEHKRRKEHRRVKRNYGKSEIDGEACLSDDPHKVGTPYEEEEVQ